MHPGIVSAVEVKSILGEKFSCQNNLSAWIVLLFHICCLKLSLWSLLFDNVILKQLCSIFMQQFVTTMLDLFG